jgi:hypothetical protein
MTQPRLVQAQRRVVLEQLKKNSDDLIFELLAEIMSIERDHRESRYGVVPDIRAAIERVADLDTPEQQEAE